LAIFILTLVSGVSVTGARYYHRDANLKLRAVSGLLDDESEFVTAFMGRLPQDGNPLRDADVPAKAEQAAALLQLYDLFGLDGLQSRLLFRLVARDAPVWATDAAMSYARWTLLSRTRFEWERGRFEAARLLGQRFINLVTAMGPADHFLSIDSELRTARRVVQLTMGRYLYDDEALSKRLLRALTVEPMEVPSVQDENLATTLGEDIDYANARARAAHSSKFSEKRAVWEQFLAQRPQSSRRLEASFNVIEATMDTYRDISTKDPDYLPRARAGSREALTMCQEFVRMFPDSYLTDDALRYILRLSFSLDERDQMVGAYVRLARLPGSPDAFKRIQYGLIRWFIEKHKATLADSRETSEWLADQARRQSTSAIVELSAVLQRIALVIGEPDPKTLLGKGSHEVVGNVLVVWLQDRHAVEGVRRTWEPSTR
jgi:hypothetical protein